MKICSNHGDYEVQLIYTFAWNGYEYWCPYCGCHEGGMGAGEDVNETKELKKRAELYEKLTAEFLGARSTLICSETMWKGKRIKPSELPKEEIERSRKFKWEYDKKAETLQ